MSIRLFGILQDGLSKPLPNTTVALLAKGNTLTLLNGTEAIFKTDNEGAYNVIVQSGHYNVYVGPQGLEPYKAGEITLYSDSLEGSLNGYLVDWTPEELTPDVIKQVQQLVSTSQQYALDAGRSSASAQQDARDARSSKASAQQSASESLVNKNDAKSYSDTAKQAQSSASGSANSANLALQEVTTLKQQADASAQSALQSKELTEQQTILNQQLVEQSQQNATDSKSYKVEAEASALAAKQEVGKIPQLIAGKQDKSEILESVSTLVAPTESVITLQPNNTTTVTPITNFAKPILAKENAQKLKEYLNLGKIIDAPISDSITSQQSSQYASSKAVSLVNEKIDNKAPIDSPTFAGTPRAQNPQPNAASTEIPTAYWVIAKVTAEIAKLAGSAPETLDTLKELADALGRDPNFATTMTNALAGKQPLNSTLTALSGKNVAQLLEYLQLGEAAKLNVGTTSGTVAAGDVTLGINQTYQDMTSSRTLGVTYTNSQTRPIVVKAKITIHQGGEVSLKVDGIQASGGNAANVVDRSQWVYPYAIIPPGSTYSISVTGSYGSIVNWVELR